MYCFSSRVSWDIVVMGLRDKPLLNIREKHMVKGLPSQCVFFLIPCYDLECPLCQGKTGIWAKVVWKWASVILSTFSCSGCCKSWSWGSETCQSCTGFCSGHYLKPEDAYIYCTQSVCEPPSQKLLKLYKSVKSSASTEIVEAKAKEVLLPVNDVSFWMEHLQTIHQNHQEGARKAAEARQKKKAVVANKSQTTEYHCGICNYLYEEETDEEEIWIACDQCQLWFYVGCVNWHP